VTVEVMAFGKALNAGLRKAMADSDRVLMMGEDIGRLGGVFRVTEGLLASFGERRVLDTPLAESGIVGTAIGLAMAGFRPVAAPAGVDFSPASRARSSASASGVYVALSVA
jgi:pyruvate dehydrogenase E1 component beta subunit